MATIKKTYELTLDLKRKSAIELTGLVAGDNGNILRISLTNGGAALDNVDINACRAVLYIRSANGWRSQDSETDDGDITIEDGIINVELHAASYAEGENLAQLEIYSNDIDEWDTLVTTQYFSFAAAAGASESIETSDAYPALIDAINRALAAAASVVSVASAHVNEDGELILTMTNGNELNAGYTRNVGDDPDHIVMTTTDGRLMAGNRLYIGEDIPDPEDYDAGDIYLRAVGDYSEMTAEAETVPYGDPATASFDEETGVFHFEIPGGEQGPVGPAGPAGPGGPAGQDGVGIPAGGSTGQVLQKASGNDYDTEWTTPPHIVIDNIAPETKSASLSDGDIYIYCADMP